MEREMKRVIPLHSILDRPISSVVGVTTAACSFLEVELRKNCSLVQPTEQSKVICQKSNTKEFEKR